MSPEPPERPETQTPPLTPDSAGELGDAAPGASSAGGHEFWTLRCPCFSKEMMLLVLMSGFIVQTCLVYSDRYDTVPLTEAAVRGRELWHRNSCGACHQLHGFGGFLGPDLTNATRRVERSQLEDLLTDNPLTERVAQMPAFDMEPDEIDAIWAYLEGMDRTGTGQARNPNLALATNLDAMGPQSSSVASTPLEALIQVVDEVGSDAASRGFELFLTRKCLTCHVLYARSSVGAPDLSLSGGMLGTDELTTVLAQGRLPKMPRPQLGGAERADVQAFIELMAAQRAKTLERVVKPPQSFLGSLPWWEYPLR